MSRSAGSPKRPWHIAAAVGALAVLAVLVVATVSSAASARGTAPASLSKSAAHKCLVMTGSGDPAFVRNFNPYTATGLPSGQFIKGAMYEGLIVVAGRRPAAPSRGSRGRWKWSERQQDADAEPREERQVVGRHARSPRPTSSTRSRAAPALSRR